MSARPVRSRVVSGWLLRVLVPSWRFFEAEDERFLLEVRIVRDGQAPSAFLPAVPSAPRSWLSCLFSPEHNLRLFCHDLIERFVLELSERGPVGLAEIEQLASYARVRDVARYFVQRAHGAHADARYELRLSALSGDADSEELFLSPAYPVGP